MRLLIILFAFGLMAAFDPTALAAQEEASERPSAARLEEFVMRVARLWSAGEVGALVEMIPEDGRFILDTGSGPETANSRHAAAALRALFAESETLRATPTKVTVAGSEPVSGFGEISWTYRARGVPGEESRSVYVAARLSPQGWRMTELRIMP